MGRKPEDILSNAAYTDSLTLSTGQCKVSQEVHMDDIRLVQLAKGHMEMVLVWSIEASFRSDSPREVMFPVDAIEVDKARSAYKAQVYRFLARLHNHAVKPKKKD